MKLKTTHLAWLLIALTPAWTCAAEPAPARQSSVEDKTRQLLGDWQARFDEEKFHAVMAGPFVIAGDGSAAQIARYRDATVLAAAKALHAQFFQTEPTEPILILL